MARTLGYLFGNGLYNFWYLSTMQVPGQGWPRAGEGNHSIFHNFENHQQNCKCVRKICGLKTSYLFANCLPKARLTRCWWYLVGRACTPRVGPEPGSNRARALMNVNVFCVKPGAKSETRLIALMRDSGASCINTPLTVIRWLC